MKTKELRTSIAFVFATLIAAPSFAAVPTNTELKVGISQEFENMNPAIMQMSATSYLFNLVGRTLVTMDATSKWVPQLAKSIPSIENGAAKLSADKKHIVANWEILETAKWGDGTPLTCADFDFARTVGTTATVSVPDRETYAQIKSITWDKTTPKKCVFTYEKARWDFYQLGTLRPIPKHLEEPVLKKYGAQKEGYEKNSNFVRNPLMEGLYCGPYKISEIKLGSHVTFVPNPNFYGPAPKIQKLVVKLIPNTGTLEANLRSGSIDKISSLGLQFDQALSFEKKVKTENLPFEVLFRPSATYEHIDFNLDNPILKDLNVRKALVLAINRDELVKALFEGKQKSALHNMTPDDPWYTSDPKVITVYPYSRREAGRLLDLAGWKLEAKDGLRYKEGKKLSLQFMTTAGNKTRETVQTFLQNQWKEAGVEIIIKNEPARVFFGETLKKRKFGAMALYAWVSSPESNPRSTLHSSSIPSEKNAWAGQNNPAWSNKKVDELIDKIDVEFDPKKRTELAHSVLKLYTDEIPVIPLFYRADVAVRPKNMSNFELTGNQFVETNRAEDWNLQ
jgi:peptide/nickel transport system substrate-binding protein